MFLSIIDWINRRIVTLVGILLMVVVIATAIQIGVRFVLDAVGINISAPWSEELARYALVWMIFLGAGVGCRKMQLISVELLVGIAPAAIGKAMRFGVIILCMAFFVLLIAVGLQFAELGLIEKSPGMGLNKAVVYWAMPIGCSLMFVNSLALLYEVVSTGQDIRDYNIHSD